MPTKNGNRVCQNNDRCQTSDEDDDAPTSFSMFNDDDINIKKNKNIAIVTILPSPLMTAEERARESLKVGWLVRKR